MTTNITDFISSLGEKSDSKLTTSDIAKFMDRKMLRLSARWSHNISKNCDSNDDTDDAAHDLGSMVNKISRSLSADCARDEIEALSLLLSMERSKTSETAQGWDEFDNASLEEEISCLNKVQDSLNLRLSRYDEITKDYSSPKEKSEMCLDGSTKSVDLRQGKLLVHKEPRLPSLHRSKSLCTLCGLTQ